MSHDTRVRILVTVIGMLIVAMLIPEVRDGSVPLWGFAIGLAWAAVIGLLSPEIERKWASSKIWGSDNHWDKR